MRRLDERGPGRVLAYNRIASGMPLIQDRDALLETRVHVVPGLQQLDVNVSATQDPRLGL